MAKLTIYLCSGMAQRSVARRPNTRQAEPTQGLHAVQPGCSRQVPGLQEAWNLVNDSLRTTLCIRYRSTTIACACIYLAARRRGFAMPEDPPWWDIPGVPLPTIEEIAAEIQALYALPARPVYISVNKGETAASVDARAAAGDAAVEALPARPRSTAGATDTNLSPLGAAARDSSQRARSDSRDGSDAPKRTAAAPGLAPLGAAEGDSARAREGETARGERLESLDGSDVRRASQKDMERERPRTPAGWKGGSVLEEAAGESRERPGSSRAERDPLRESRDDRGALHERSGKPREGRGRRDGKRDRDCDRPRDRDRDRNGQRPPERERREGDRERARDAPRAGERTPAPAEARQAQNGARPQPPDRERSRGGATPAWPDSRGGARRESPRGSPPAALPPPPVDRLPPPPGPPQPAPRIRRDADGAGRAERPRSDASSRDVAPVSAKSEGSADLPVPGPPAPPGRRVKQKLSFVDDERPEAGIGTAARLAAEAGMPLVARSDARPARPRAHDNVELHSGDDVDIISVARKRARDAPAARSSGADDAVAGGQRTDRDERGRGGRGDDLEELRAMVHKKASAHSAARRNRPT
jgi:hypothetical protein